MSRLRLICAFLFFGGSALMGLAFGVFDLTGVSHDRVGILWFSVFFGGVYVLIRGYLNVKRGIVPVHGEGQSRVVIKRPEGFDLITGGAGLAGLVGSLVMIIVGAAGGLYLGILSLITLATSFVSLLDSERPSERPVTPSQTGFAKVSFATRSPVTRVKRKSKKRSR